MAKGSGSMSIPSGLKSAIGWIMGLGVAALVLLIFLILFGNLSGNVGFATDTQGYNDTQSTILNYSLAATNTSAQFPTVGTIIGIALLLLVLIAILIFAIRALTSLGGSGSNANFG